MHGEEKINSIQEAGPAKGLDVEIAYRRTHRIKSKDAPELISMS